jgi:hypothetical protein
MLYARAVAELARNVRADAADHTSFLRAEELAFEQLRAFDPYSQLTPLQSDRAVRQGN